MILTIYTDPTSLFFNEIIQLDGVEYFFQFWWSTRESCWYISIFDQNKSAIASGVRVTVNWPLLRRYTDPRIPPGTLICFDTSGTYTDIIEPTDLGQRCQLYYITAA